ncbi:MAG TPA: phosphoribosylanthranilate isomerase [Bacteroidota bacterium]|nr:phosphoribosylanthranilate isomerase [Bacteroidota bacterium]
MSTRVKICGITRHDDASAAAEAGAAAVGFILVKNSPRYVHADTVRSIVKELPPFVTPVGVFADVTRSEVLAAVAKSGIRAVQLHGEGNAKEFEDFPVPVYRVFRVSVEFNPEILRRYRGTAFMLDTFKNGVAGGTGQTFDWNVAIEAKKYGRLILSGGINPENVGEAIRRVGPYAIDTSSGVEKSPGVKDHAKIRRLFEEIRKAENEGRG